MPHTQVDEGKLAYRAYLNTQRGWSHHTHDEDMKQYQLMQAGDPRAPEEAERIIRSGTPGTLSADPVRNMKYLFVCTATIATRFAIEGGMEAEEAYNASDLYIQCMGFSSQGYFTRVFRGRTGFTPSEFRKRFFRESEMGSA